MSSYITSPYMLEQRRLQGIVDQCSRNLNLAMQDVRRQQELMQQMKKDQANQDKQYFVKQDQAEADYQRHVREEQASQEKHRQRIADMLHNIQIELEAMQDGSEEWKAAYQRQERLNYRLRNATENLEVLEQDIKTHLQQTEQTMGVRSDSWLSSVRYREEAKAPVSYVGSKGVSLKMEGAGGSIASASDSPLEVFEQKLEKAGRSSFCGRFKALEVLRGEFSSQPEYAKAAFAVHHMKKLDDILRQLEALENQQKTGTQKWEQLVVQYKAVCGLLEVPPEEALLTDERSARLLQKRCSELYAEYQEVQKREYVSGALAEVMGRHGIQYTDSQKERKTGVMRFAMEHAWVDVSGGMGDQLVMEVTGSYTGDAPTLNDRRKSVTSATKLCSLMKEIEAELREEYGIVFGQMLAERPSETTIMMEQDTSHVEEHRRKEVGKKYLSENNM